jgi:hypothetical protein
MAKKVAKVRTRRVSADDGSRLFEGMPVVDAAENVALVITKQDVSNSKQKDPGSCAAAMAGRREFKTDVRVFLTRTFVKDSAHKRWIRFQTPDAISREIIAFDRGAAFDPGEYELKAPTPAMRRGYIKKTGGKATGASGKTMKKRHVTGNVRVSAKNY